MKEETYVAADGAKITYYKTGEGEALLCMHGSGRDKEQWEKNGWLQELKKHYTIIAMDIRGFGNSSVFHESQYYKIDRILDDIRGIMKACNVETFRYFGHSYGATIGFQAIRAGLPITKAVFASGSMGSDFFKEVCPQALKEYQYLVKIKKEHKLDELTDYSEDDIEFIKNNDMEKFAALFEAWSKWKPVSVNDVRDKVSIYAGTLDHNKEMVENTTVKQDYFQSYGIDTKCFEGLNHEELITKSEICLPWVLEHLA